VAAPSTAAAFPAAAAGCGPMAHTDVSGAPLPKGNSFLSQALIPVGVSAVAQVTMYLFPSRATPI